MIHCLDLEKFYLFSEFSCLIPLTLLIKEEKEINPKNVIIRFLGYENKYMIYI